MRVQSCILKLINGELMKIDDYKLSIFFVFWCLLNLFVLPDLIDGITMPKLHFMVDLYLSFAIAALLFAPYILVTIEFNKLGKRLTTEDNLTSTFFRLSPLIFIYFSLIVLIWYPSDGDLIAATIFTAQNLNWWQLGIWAVIIYYTAAGTIKRPYDNVITALLGLLATNHLLQMYTWYRLDDGCHSDIDGYVYCDDSYVQRLDRVIEDAASVGITHESLIAAELYTMLAYCLTSYIIIAFIKDRF